MAGASEHYPVVLGKHQLVQAGPLNPHGVWDWARVPDSSRDPVGMAMIKQQEGKLRDEVSAARPRETPSGCRFYTAYRVERAFTRLALSSLGIILVKPRPRI